MNTNVGHPPKGTTRSVVRTCLVCGTEFRIYMAWLRDGRGGQFCSRACQAKGAKHRPKTMFVFSCKECGQQFERRKGQEHVAVYCSRRCKNVANGKMCKGTQLGPQRARKTHGMVNPRVHLGLELIEWARKVRRRDGKCCRCGSKQSLQAHHMIPVCEAPLLALCVENGETLCADCHAKEHPQQAGMLRTIGKLR